MARKKKHPPAPVPPGNRPQAGPSGTPGGPPEDQPPPEKGDGAPFQEEDPKRRLGDYTGAGEHSYQQPGGKNDANR